MAEVSAQGQVMIQYEDCDRDTVQTTFDTAAHAADGADYQTNVTKEEALVTALNAVTLGTLRRKMSGGILRVYDDSRPAITTAQTNIQWRLVFDDNVTGKRLTARVGTADINAAVTIDDGLSTYTGLDLNDEGVGEALKTAFDAVVLSPDGNVCTLKAVVYVQ